MINVLFSWSNHASDWNNSVRESESSVKTRRKSRKENEKVSYLFQCMRTDLKTICPLLKPSIVKIIDNRENNWHNMWKHYDDDVKISSS